VPRESEKERVDRELVELLNEVRVAVPGAQVLLAFLLGVVFTERFTSLTSLQRGVYFATLLLVAASIALLIAPTAYHRANFREGNKEQLLRVANRMVLASLALLLASVTGVVFLVADLLYAIGPALVVGGLTAAWFLWFWFVVPLTHRSGEDEAGDSVR
jgi:hypothetical protein